MKGMMRPVLFAASALVALTALGLAVAYYVGPNDVAQPAPTTQPDTRRPTLAEEIARLAGQYALGAEHGVLFYGYDALAYPNQPVTLSARVQRSSDLQGLSGMQLGFYLGEERQGSAQTDATGLASLPFTPSQEGDFAFEVRIEQVPDSADPEIQQVQPAPLHVLSRSRETKIALVDLDRTVVQSGLGQVLLGSAGPMPDAAAVLRDLVETQHLTLVYLTYRPNLLARRSKQWLKANGFPDGVLITSTLEQVMEGSDEYKSAKITELHQSYPNVVMGIGDRISDAQTCLQQGIQPYLIPNYNKDLKGMQRLAGKIEGLDLSIQVVRNWQDIKQGALNGRRFPPHQFADFLRRQAELQQAERENNPIPGRNVAPLQGGF